MIEGNRNMKKNWSYIAFSLIVSVTLTVLVLYMPGLRDFDMGLLKTIRKFLGQFPSYIPVFFSNYGGVGNFWWPQITAGAVLISHQKYLKTFLLIFFTQGAYILTDIFKNFICRERPCIHPGYSFPSGHTLTAMCFYGIIIYLVMQYVRSHFWRVALSIFFSFMIFMTAISRLWLGVHFLTDVLAAIFFGFIVVNLYIILDKFFAKS